MEAAKHTPSSESLQTDVWADSFAQQAHQWEVPLVDLRRLGLHHDQDGFISSKELIALTSGAEAQPYLDREAQVVYKLFDLKINGSLGKKIVLTRDPEIGFEVETQDAIWTDTLEKLSVLNDAGGLITEIVGLASTGDYLIAKQPLAYPHENYLDDLFVAQEAIKAVKPIGGGLRQPIIISYVNDQPWLIGDLHERNIMRDSLNRPTIIDALIGSVYPSALKQLPWLRQGCEDAWIYRETGVCPVHDPFDGIDDSQL